MSYLLDSNVPSESMKRLPDPNVLTWVQAQPPESLFLSAVSIGEFRRGTLLIPEGPRRAQLEAWIEFGILALFRDRVLPVTQQIADRWGRLDAQRRLAGRPMHVPDGMIAATAFEHNLTPVTRNVKDFDGLGLRIWNPWQTTA